MLLVVDGPPVASSLEREPYLTCLADHRLEQLGDYLAVHSATIRRESRGRLPPLAGGPSLPDTGLVPMRPARPAARSPARAAGRASHAGTRGPPRSAAARGRGRTAPAPCGPGSPA